MLLVSHLRLCILSISFVFAIDTITTNGRHFVDSSTGAYVHSLCKIILISFSFGPKESMYMSRSHTELTNTSINQGDLGMLGWGTLTHFLMQTLVLEISF